MTRHQGFTLIELMIVVAIIAILAAIAIAQYQDYVVRSEVSEGMSLADGVKTAVGEFLDSNGRLPLTNNEAGLANAFSISGSYVSRVSLTPAVPGLVLIEYNAAKAHAKLKVPAVRFLAFSPITHAGSLEWHCITPSFGPAANQLPQKWCPSTCVCNGS
jgi:type IV pilus assembly protein PilA